MEPTIHSPVSLQPTCTPPPADKGQPTAKDDKMLEKALIEAHTAIANGKVVVGVLLWWRDEILALVHNCTEKLAI